MLSNHLKHIRPFNENLCKWILRISAILAVILVINLCINLDADVFKSQEVLSTTLAYAGLRHLLFTASETTFKYTLAPTRPTHNRRKMNGSCELWFNKSDLCLKIDDADLPNGSNSFGGRSKRCAMTIFPMGRLGNLMGQYASLIGLAKLNVRPAFQRRQMAKTLTKYFQVSLPVLEPSMERNISWTVRSMNDWMEESYAHLKGPFVLVNGYLNSWTFYHHVRDLILHEFRFHADITARAQSKLRAISGRRIRTALTYVGIHVRRGDYVHLMKNLYHGVVADAAFFVKATDYFRRRFSDAVFVVASDDIGWCVKNIDNSLGDVYFSGANAEPAEDMALLANCNHSIITIGTFGFWSAYLAGGQTVYLTNYTMPDSTFLRVLKYDAFYLPQWIPIAANLSEWATT